MRRLFTVELTRLRWRRAVILLVAASFAIPAAIWVGVAWSTRPVSPAELAEVQAQVERDRQDPDTQRTYQECLDNPEEWGAGGGDVEAACDEMILPQVEWYGIRTPLDLRDQLTASGGGVVVLVAVLMMLAGTTFAGHDWHSASMSNQLLFEPRRLRVWLAKGAVVMLAAVVVAAAVLTAYWASMWVLADARDIATPGGVLDRIQGSVVRGTLLVGFAALGAYALTMLFRNTVATVGVLFAFVIASPILLAALGFSGNDRWMPHTNVSAIIFDGTTYYVEDSATGTGRLSLAGGVSYYAVLLVLAIVPSLWSFTSRDVP